MSARFIGPVFSGLLGLLLGAVFLARAADPPAKLPASSPEAIAASLALARQQAETAQARKDWPALAQALNDQTDALLRAHNFAAAEKLRLQVLRLQEEHAGRDSVAVSDALLNLGWYYTNLARYEEAQTAFDRCLEIRQRKLGQETAPVAEALNAIGALEENRGNLDLAEAFYEQAIAIREKVLGPQSLVTATSWNNLATLYWIQGEYADAEKLFNQALAVRQKQLGPNSPVVATTLNNLALLDSSLGDYDEAEKYFQKALKIRSTVLGPDHPSMITTVGQLGLLYIREGDDVKAEPLLVHSVDILRKLYPEGHPDVARSLSQLGQLYDRRHDYARAEPLLQQALAIRRRVLGTAHTEYASSLAALARHDHAQGRLAEALPLYKDALKIDEDALGVNHPETVSVAADLAYLQLELGHKDDATGLALDVAEAQQHTLNSIFTFTAERQRMDFEKTIGPCDLPAALGDPDLLAEVILRTKGVVLDSLLEDEAVSRAERDPEVRQLMEKKRQLSAEIVRAQEDLTGPYFANTPEAMARRRELEKEELDLEARLTQKGVGSGRMRRALETDPADVQAALPRDTALIEFVAYDRYLGQLCHEQAYGALIVTHDGPFQWVPLGSSPGIDAQVKLFQKYMRKRVREQAVAGVLRSLYQSLIQPVVAGLPPGIKHLVLSPDGNLNFVSFAAVLDGSNQFLAEDYTIDYVGSGRDLLGKRRDVTGRRQFVVFANPDYNRLPASSPVRIRGDDLLPPLPGTAREATALQQYNTGDVEVRTYLGEAASKVNLAKQDSPYVLHLATHGLYLSPDDIPSVPGSDGSDKAKAIAGQPMLRSVLALAGAGVTLRDWKRGVFPPAENDGLLTAQDVAGLNLDRTWLVTLSACDSGSGEAQCGEGVLGLRRGFAEAGAQNVLMTLWTVDDAGTADLMQTFYREALRTGNAPGSLAAVQRDCLVDWRKKLGLSEAVRKAGPFILSY